MENIKVSRNGKQIILTIDSSKVIGQTVKGADKFAESKFERIEGTNLKLLLQLFVGKQPKEKTEAAPAEPVRRAAKTKTIVAPEPEPEPQETEEQIAARRAARLKKAERNVKKGIATENDLKVIRRALRKTKTQAKAVLQDDEEIRPTRAKKVTAPVEKTNTKSRRPERPKSGSKLRDPDYSNVEF